MEHSRRYSYDEPSASYPGGQVPQNDDPQFQHAVASPYAHGYGQQPGSGQYYVQSSGNVNEATQQGPYYRGMSPMVTQPPHRYSASGSEHERYYESQAGASSSHLSQSPYGQASFYAGQYPSSRQHGAAQPDAGPFIPTPTDMVQSYNTTIYPPRQIAMPPQSPASPADRQGHYVGSVYPPVASVLPASRTAASSSHRTSSSSKGSGKPQIAPGPPVSSSSSSGERFLCERCGKTFSRSHDRKRHHETQHLATPILHRCRFCEKEFSRADSLKRHLDNGCDEMPS